MGSARRSRAKLASVRKQIDRLDFQLLRLLNRRACMALQIGRIKKRKKWPVYDARREAFVLRRVAQANSGPLSSAAVRQIFQTVLTQCRRRERSSRKGSRG